jgi:inhibitor of KinA sporulation pathway (predicted exonuclease)
MGFEVQCVNGQTLEVQEIIELQLVIVYVKNLTVMQKYFHYYLEPTKYPILFYFCTELTGIQQEQVDKGRVSRYRDV